MFKKVLVPVSGSAHSLHALKEVKRLSDREGCDIAVLSVERDGVNPEEVRELAGNILGKNFLFYEDKGDPVSRIVGLAEGGDFDLIVLGKRLGKEVGKVIKNVVVDSPIDVFVIPLGSSIDFSTILLPTDGKEHSKKAESKAVWLAHSYRGKLFVLDVLDLTKGLLSEHAIEYESNVRQAHEVIDAVKEKALELSKDIKVEGILKEGSPPEVILEVAKEKGTGTLVLGCRGVKGLVKLFTGSVSEKVIEKTNIPVLVVKRGYMVE
jgi:nucleotide-binding universal stress UspA family protein